MPASAPVRPATLIALLVLAITAAACGAGREATGVPPPPNGAPGAADSSPAAVPSDAAEGSAAAVPPSGPPGPPGGSIDPATPTACLGLGAQDCERARAMAASVLVGGDPPARYVQVGPFGCPDAACATTLADRPEGDVTIELDGGTGVSVHLVVAPDGTFQAARGPAGGIDVAPTSAGGLPSGPVPFTLGHCGILSGFDVAGSWWDPVGPVEVDSGEAVNATPGTFVVTDLERATFTTSKGFAIQLERRAGSKLLPFCM